MVVVGGGPAGLAAALAARAQGRRVTLVERYPYLGGLASGGMVLVLDDMHNGDEITVRGVCMEMIDRMARVGAAVFPPPRRIAAHGCDVRPQMGALGRVRLPRPGQAAADRAWPPPSIPTAGSASPTR